MRVVGCVPVAEQPVQHFVAAVADAHAAVALVEAERFVGIAITEQREGVPLPCLLLPAVVSQLDDGRPRRERTEDASRFDRGQLAGVADDDELAARGVDALEQLRELTGAEHARLVDHEDGPGLDGAPCRSSA